MRLTEETASDVMNATWLVLDYAAICESRNELLNFEDFIPLWIEANQIAEESDTRRCFSVKV